jgi:hypothetical protein
MRNGDYIPTRMESQADAVNLICNVKTQQNPESTVGVMTSAGRGYDLKPYLAKQMFLMSFETESRHP